MSQPESAHPLPGVVPLKSNVVPIRKPRRDLFAPPARTLDIMQLDLDELIPIAASMSGCTVREHASGKFTVMLGSQRLAYGTREQTVRYLRGVIAGEHILRSY